jgi:16S rRNA (guanine527-N7)-methyltransferase
MDDARIAELLAPFLTEGSPSSGKVAVLSSSQIKYISIYIDILLHWNDRINLTAVRRPEEIVTRHFGESFFAARHLFAQPQGGTEPGGSSAAHTPHVIDVGSGPGFPGLPIKIWAPSVRLTLIESNHKKATFLREVVRSLGLMGVDVFTGRANAFAGSKADVVTLRAVERMESMVLVAAGLVNSVGRLAMLIGEAQIEGIRQLLPGLKWDGPVRLPLSDSRALILCRKEP